MPDDDSKQMPENGLKPGENPEGRTDDNDLDSKSAASGSFEEKEEPDKTADAGSEDFHEKPLKSTGANGHRRRSSWWLMILLAVVVISVCNTLWNKVEDKLESLNSQITETIASQSKTVDEIKTDFDEIKAVSDEREIRMRKAERYIVSIRNKMKDIDAEMDGMRNIANRHEEWLQKDLETKKLELEKLTSMISDLENILSEDHADEHPNGN